MSEEVIVQMTIKFINGSEGNYELPRQIIDESIIAKKIQEALESKHNSLWPNQDQFSGSSYSCHF